jgi:hypothetical protein
MKTSISKWLYIKLIIGITVLTVTSCKKDFLDETLITTKNLGDYKTQQGLDDAVVGVYQGLDYLFYYEWAYATANYGVDEFSVGGDRTEQMWNSYDATFNSLLGGNAGAATLWDYYYGNINIANVVIENVPIYYGNNSNKNVRLGEGYFMRAFDYFKLVKQYGGVPLKLTQTTGIEYDFSRNTAKEVYEQIIKDFMQAYSLLPSTPAQQGRLTKWAAAHFLAKTYLFRASELYSDWNSATKTSDLDSVIKYGTAVINSGSFNLATNFSDLWNYTKPDGPNESSTEIILAAQFSNNTATHGRYGNQMHLYFPSIYNTVSGMVRDLAGDREFQRCRSTDYALDVYDRVNDSRFWKSFKTAYTCNNPTGAPKWTASNAPTPAQVGTARFVGGDTGILYIINDAGDTRYNASYLATATTPRKPNLYTRFYSGEAANLKTYAHGNYDASHFVALSKYMDGSRTSVADQFGCRDGIIARLADTYLMVAEAYGRKNQYDQALPFINAVRDRAAYKSGEDRSFYVDGGVSYKNNSVATGLTSYAGYNTYYESNNIAVTTAATSLHLNSTADIFNSTREFYTQLSAASNADKFLQFILNERARELMGELHRWEDLTRTKTLIQRCSVFSNEAIPQDPKHYLRPIPQTFLDGILRNGQALTAAEKAALQNPGW